MTLSALPNELLHSFHPDYEGDLEVLNKGVSGVEETYHQSWANAVILLHSEAQFRGLETSLSPYRNIHLREQIRGVAVTESVREFANRFFDEIYHLTLPDPTRAQNLLKRLPPDDLQIFSSFVRVRERLGERYTYMPPEGMKELANDSLEPTTPTMPICCNCDGKWILKTIDEIRPFFW